MLKTELFYSSLISLTALFDSRRAQSSLSAFFERDFSVQDFIYCFYENTELL